MGSRMRFGIPGCLVAVALAASASPAAAVTIGQLAPGTAVPECTGQFDLVQPTVTSGNSYVVPSTGGVSSWTVTSWSTNASSDPGQLMALKMFRKVGDPASYKAIGHEGPHTLTAGLRTFPANIQVKAGDLLGAQFAGAAGACAFQVLGNTIFYRDGELADGASGAFLTDTPYRLNATAEVTPTSDFTLGKLKRKANGTAVLTVSVPNPGQLTVSGKGVKASATGAVAAEKVTAAGNVKLVIRAKGKKKRKLAETGKVTVKPTITFTPTGGAASTESRKIKLRQQ